MHPLMHEGDVPDLKWAGEEEPEDSDETERENILAKVTSVHTDYWGDLMDWRYLQMRVLNTFLSDLDIHALLRILSPVMLAGWHCL